MDTPQFIRKIQSRQGSITITIPTKMAQSLRFQRGQYVVIEQYKDGLIVRPVPGYQASHEADSKESPNHGEVSSSTDLTSSSEALDGLMI